MSWPVLKALRREFPQAEIHGLFRERFAEAAHISGTLDRIHELPSNKIFSNLFSENTTDSALMQVESFLGQMQNENFDLVLNLSFSPLSSYLSSAIKTPNTTVYGYQRHSDGFLNLADDVSRYFYAQVGTHQFNRIHVTDLMGLLAQVPLIAEDSKFFPTSDQSETLKKYDLLRKDLIAFHLGASEVHKRLTPEFWRSLILQIKVRCPEFHLVLVGSKDDQLAATMIEKSLHGERIMNLAGQTTWRDLENIFAASRLFIGADSGPMHLAGLMQTPVLNLSVGSVNFWETGPRFAGAHVIRADDEQKIVQSDVLEATRCLLLGQVPARGYHYTSGTPCFTASGNTFEWQLIQAIYLSEPYPSTEKMSFVKAVQDLSELNDLALEALRKFRDTKLDFLGPYLDRIYESMNLIGKTDSSVSVFVNWLRAEKCRIPPASPFEICEGYTEIHQGLRTLLQPYILPKELAEGSISYG
ncbi:MAG: glycosyltransferase family 9 protein [Bdellovibrionaceae bacterium]|nr:glycosyltransferase family 9 protein [Pseudobdellovibrionaceae bacterium]